MSEKAKVEMEDIKNECTYIKKGIKRMEETGRWIGRCYEGMLLVTFICGLVIGFIIGITFLSGSK